MPKIIRLEHPKGRNRCIFCGSTSKISKEHIFGDWLKEHFPRDANTTHTSAHISWPKNVITKAPIDIRRQRQGHSGSKKLRVVCRDCNSGWLSGLENWAKKALPPLIFGKRCNLVPEGQARLAAWAVKTAMVAANFKPRETGITQKERSLLMNTLAPPNNWFVWISAYKGEDWADLAIFQDRASLSPVPVPDPDSAPYYVQATTFGVGRILFSVLSSSSPGIGQDFAGNESDGFIQIWPAQPRSILWPPTTIFGDTQANAVANILRQTKAFNHSLDRAADWTFTF